MAIVVQCGACDQSFKTKDEHAGRQTKCPNCGDPLKIPAPPPVPEPPHSAIVLSDEDVLPVDALTESLSEIKDLLVAIGKILQAGGSPAAPSARGARQYKVLTQKDKWFSGKFDPEKLEQAINAYAGQGWTVKGITTASIPGFGGNRDEMIVLLER